MPIDAVNCRALTEKNVESELFGHRKGALTGDDSHRKGLIEIADGGTLFLDELGELDRNTQVKLLRVLESGEVRRIGENEPFHVDVRVVSATNRSLQEMVDEGSFREDLYFRVNTFEIRLPALRERTDDLAALANHLIKRLHATRRVPMASLAPCATAVLQKHRWKGNVRELANTIEYALTLCEGSTITADDLPDAVSGTIAFPAAPASSPDDIWSPDSPQTLRDIEMKLIYRVLDKHNGDKPKAASELGIALKTLYNKLNQDEARSTAS